MDKRKSILNVSVSIFTKLILTVSVIVVRRFLIRYCGNEANGLNDLYISILGFFAIAELGVGSAVCYCMYRPIVDGEADKVAALYQLLRKLYWAIGGVILLGGLCVSPFLHIFARDYAQLGWNLQFNFLLMLASVVITYLYGAETTLINAYKNNYITTAINSLGMLLQQVLQIIVLVWTSSFTWYLACRIVAALLQWCVAKIIARKKYRALMQRKARLEKETVAEVVKNLRALFMHKIGGFLVNTVDSVVVSSFVGVVVLGAYSNYAAIMNGVGNLLRLAFSSLTSVVGHLYVEKTKQTTRRYFDVFHTLNFMLGVVAYLGYYAIIDDLVALLFAEDLIMARSVAMAATMNGFIQFLRHSTLLFRDATGTFYYDRWKPLFEGLTNLGLSILLVNKIGVTGVIVATVITNLLVCHIVEPYVLHKYAFEVSPKKFYAKNYGMILTFFAALLLLDRLMQSTQSHWMQLLINGCISVAISGSISLVLVLFNYKKIRLLKDEVRKEKG